ncbi:MAG: Gfo/Idh/MocA family oxidoreductase [Rhodobacteraceae bacterium]|nr:Gfo/Idh/MocA family oxidoreductase [Paracoccaceae bacterium]
MRELVADIPRRRRLRAGMVGGGRGSFFAPVHRAALRLSNRFDLVAGAFSSDPATGREAGAALGLAPARNHGDFRAFAEDEAGRADPVEVVIVVTPNHLHFEPCRQFLAAGIPVICDKPLAATAAEARTLARLAAADDRFLAVTYTYTGYPMVRDARARIREGEIGEVRFVAVEYLLEWLADDPARLGKGGVWRGDPARAGATGALGDVGTHAFHLAEFLTGQRCTALAARLLSTVAGFGLDDTDVVQMEFDGGAHGLLWASLAAPGHRNGLRFRIVGSRGTLEWQQEAPETLRLSRLNAADLVYRRGQADNTPDARTAISLPAGNPEAYLEALANLYCDCATALEAGRDWRRATPVPLADAAEGLRGVLLSEAAVASSRARAWVPFPAG